MPPDDDIGVKMKDLFGGECPCGGDYMIGHIEGQPHVPVARHSNPSCAEFGAIATAMQESDDPYARAFAFAAEKFLAYAKSTMN